MKYSLSRLAMTRVMGLHGLPAAFVAVALLAGCTPATVRLDDKFDSDTLGGLPSPVPPPTPPNDSISFRTDFFTTSVVADPAGGRWMRIQPNQAFTSSPDGRRIVMIAASEAFTTSPAVPIRGSMRMRLDGLGIVGMGLRPLQAGQTLDFIGGVQVGNYLPPAGSGIDGLRAFNGAQLTSLIGLPSTGHVGGYSPGQVIDINWSIDQASRTFSVTAGGGQPVSGTFAPTSGSVATTPIQQLLVYVWMDKPTSSTQLFIDNVHAEETK
jgi:hypothetical protein